MGSDGRDERDWGARWRFGAGAEHGGEFDDGAETSVELKAVGRVRAGVRGKSVVL